MTQALLPPPACVAGLLLLANSTGNLLRLPPARWTAYPLSEPFLPPNNNSTGDLPAPPSSCGCWTLQDERWVELDLGSPRAIVGIETTLTQPYAANLSADARAWSTYACDHPPHCPLPPEARLAAVRYVRILLLSFDESRADYPSFQAAALACRYGVRASALAPGDAASSLVQITHSDPSPPTPTLLRSPGNNASAVPLAVFDEPLCGARAGTPEYNVLLDLTAQWLGDALDLLGALPELRAFVLAQQGHCRPGDTQRRWVLPLLDNLAPPATALALYVDPSPRH